MNIRKMLTKGTALALSAFMLAGCGSSIDSNAAVVTINGGEDTISLGYANFVAHLKQADYDMYYRSYFGDDYWTQDISGSGSTTEETVKETIMTEIENTYLASAHASDYGVELSDADKQAITEAAQAFIADNSADAIKQIGATQELVEEYLTKQTLAQRVEGVIKDDTDVSLTDEETEQSTIAYTYFETQEFDEQNIQVDKSEEDIAEAKKHAEAVAAADGDFEEDVEAEGGTYTEYHFTKAEDPAEDPQLDEALITAAKKLKDGERSDVIEVEDDAFYVVYMIKADDKEATEDKVEELTTQKKAEAFTEIIDGWTEETDWEVNEDQWAKVQFIELFGAKSDGEEDADASEESAEEATDAEADEESAEETTDADAEEESAEETTDAEAGEESSEEAAGEEASEEE